MPTLNARASVVAGTTNTTWNTTASAVDGAYGVVSATYANFTSTVSGAVGTIDLGFGSAFASIPAGSVITDLSVTLRHYESNTARLVNVQFQPYDNVTAIGSLFTATRDTAARSDTASFTPSLAQLKSANFKIKVTATRAAVTQAGIFYIDYVDVAVTYVAPPVADFTISNTAPNVGTPTTFTDTSTNAPTSWTWTFASGTPASSSTQGPHAVSWGNPGTYNVTLVVSNSAGSNQITKQVMPAGLPLIQIWNGVQWKTGALAWNGTQWRSDARVWDGSGWRNFG